ncbi:MAG: BrnT family toxin [Candidatus Competibacteraceae bacterium]
MTLRYLCDPAKKAEHLRKHGLDFDDAPRIIESNTNVIFEDRRFDYGEQRFITMDFLGGKVVVVISTETDQEIRVISMRKATQHEQKIYSRNRGR